MVLELYNLNICLYHGVPAVLYSGTLKRLNFEFLGIGSTYPSNEQLEVEHADSMCDFIVTPPIFNRLKV